MRESVISHKRSAYSLLTRILIQSLEARGLRPALTVYGSSVLLAWLQTVHRLQWRLVEQRGKGYMLSAGLCPRSSSRGGYSRRYALLPTPDWANRRCRTLKSSQRVVFDATCGFLGNAITPSALVGRTGTRRESVDPLCWHRRRCWRGAALLADEDQVRSLRFAGGARRQTLPIQGSHPGSASTRRHIDSL